MMAEKTKKYHDMSTDELQRTLNDTRHELMNLRFQQATGELTDYTRLSQTRRQIARLLSILHERELKAVGEKK
jgi:large subunit ribosomal protein L29